MSTDTDTDTDTEPTEPATDTEPAEPTEPATDAEHDENGSDTTDADTFPREYVEELREEASSHRRAARQARERVADLEAEVWRLRVSATGRLADPADLPIPEDRLDADLEAEVTALLEAKPHLAARRAGGRVGQGEPTTTPAPSLGDMLRAGA